MSVIKAGTTLTTAYTVEADTTGALEFKTGTSATLAMSISASGVVTFPATTGFDIASANITNLTSRSLTVSAATYLATASGVVGIGTTNPSATVGIVDGANNANGQLRLSSAGSFGTRMTFVSTSTNGRTYQIGSNFVDGNGEFAIYDATASASRFWINASGNVGIGTTSPAYKLDVNGGISLNAKSLVGTSGYFICGTNGFRWNNSTDAFNNVIMYDNGTTQFRNAISVGDVTPTTSGAGITFPATQSASSNANTLDDYEEGTWTPSAVCTGQTITYTSRSGSYTKIGNTVRAQCLMVINTVTGSAGGNTTISGLPFSNGDGTYSGQGIIGYNDGFANAIYGTWLSGSDALFRSGTRSSGNDAGGFSAGGYIYIEWIYIV